MLDGYDSFGNMLPTDNVAGWGPYSIDPATNRMLNGADIQYYGNGSVMTANSHTFLYTAEGYLRSIDNYSMGSYLYNGMGERTLSVRNDQPSNNYANYSVSENVYLNGQTMAEYDLAGAPWTWANYVYANGQKIARLTGGDPTNPQVHYYLDDQLGTAQMELDAMGTPTWSGWYTPFGQEITSGWATNYIGNQPADGTSMRFKFTGKERDQESGLDYFGARYYASSMGRWMSPDWAAKATPVPYAKLDNPQSFNLYGYVLNNPLSMADADGHDGCGDGFGGCAAFRAPPIGKTDAVVAGGVLSLFLGPEIAAGARVAWTAATTFCIFHCGEVAAHLVDAASPPGSPSLGSVWSMGWAARGAAIESQLGGNLPAGFQTIDRFVQGEATSIKSLDLNASSYQSGGKLLSTVEGYIDKVAAFSGGTRGDVTIKAGQITGRELQLAVPGAGTAAQQAALKSASAYAQKEGVKLTITQVH